ncbi:hypothetical protein Scep_029149 [Stephania cephalantha]|uniref:Uncharacterized protein n=1 Tax=Stephania cephalantha TaxID=152367 RepID=A0AAP0HBZ6_9MAGN
MNGNLGGEGGRLFFFDHIWTRLSKKITTKKKIERGFLRWSNNPGCCCPSKSLCSRTNGVGAIACLW